MKRPVAAVSVLVVALLLQLTLVNGLALPGGGTPDLVLLSVVVIGLVSGPKPGLVSGFWVGLALDLAPPASEPVGQYAFVLCLVGYFAGRLRPTLFQSAGLALTAGAVVAAAGELFGAVVTVVLDAPQASFAMVAHVLPSTALYDIALSPFAVFFAVRAAVALGMDLSPFADTPVHEAGGSAAPTELVGMAGLRRSGQAGFGHGGLGLATGSWLIGDAAGEAGAVGAVGWLSGPATSRRARREQARLTAMLTGATTRKGAFWVGARPAGLNPTRPVGPARPAWRSGLDRLRPQAGVAGSATRDGWPAPTLPSRPVHLGLADEQRKRRGGTGAAGSGRGRFAADGHGPDRHGVDGPGVPKISFGGGGLPGSGRAERPGVPKISFGGGRLPGAGRAERPGVPKIGFGTGSLPGSGGTEPRRTPKISFRGGRLPGAGRAERRRTPKISFRSGKLPRAARTSPGRPAAPKFRSGSAKPASGSWLAASASAGSGGLRGGRRAGRRKRPRFRRGASYPAAPRQHKTARMRSARKPVRWLPWLRRAGGRSAVWRIGSKRNGGYR